MELQNRTGEASRGIKTRTKSSTEMRQAFQNLIKDTGIEINGDNPWDMKVHDPEVFRKFLSGGSLALGELYMDGCWDCDQLDELIARLFKEGLDNKVKSMHLIFLIIKARLLNLQNRKQAKKVADVHYNLGNDLYQAMLDENMCYSCGYFKNAKNLNEAQEAKLDLICRKLGIQPGMKVLDIGGGWGSFAKYAAKNYKTEVDAVTISEEQQKLGEERCKGLPVRILLQDYRELGGKKYDRVVSVGMFEHVGYKNYRKFMEIVEKCLKDDGIFLLHTIGGKIPGLHADPWLQKYIFPSGMLPSISQISSAFEGLFVMEDWHNFGSDYYKTLMAWYENFEKNWPLIKGKYDERFYRMWRFYLLACAGSFKAREMQLWQIVLSKKGVPGGYASVR